MNRQNEYLMIMNCVWLQEWANSPPLKTKLMRYKVGNGKWKWFAFKGKPLYWMVLPPLPKTNLDGISSIEQLSKLFKLE